MAARLWDMVDGVLERTVFNAQMGGEDVTYSRDSLEATIPVMFDGEAAIDELIDSHIYGETCICYVREADLHTLFGRRAEIGDYITRSLDPGPGEAVRLETWRVVQRRREEDGTWRLVLERNTRVVP